MKFNPDERCQPQLTQCPRCNNPNGDSCDLGNALSMQAYQASVGRWCVELFGKEVATNIPLRVFRFLEEALELAQSLGCTEGQALTLISYVFNRPVGDPKQEVGGTAVTLAALCEAAKISLNDAAWGEQGRCQLPEVKAKIKAKQASKVDRFGILPGAPSGQ